MQSRVQHLGEILRNIDSIPWNLAVFVRGSPPWTVRTEAAVLDPNDSPDPEQDPEFARQNGLQYALSVQDTRGVCSNALAQDVDAPLNVLTDAFNHYYLYDAYLDLKRRSGGTAD
jgi:hypothetical protein